MKILRTLLACLPGLVVGSPTEIRAEGLATKGQVEFKNDLIPVFTKLGCNAGACHGAAVGRGGFRLSLYGGDPAADYQNIVKHLEGRRINPAKPEQSLIVLKPTEEIAHEGGYLIEDDAESKQLLVDWITQGASWTDNKELTGVEISPKRFVASKLGEPIQLSAIATFSDGSHRDVTRWTVFTAEDDSAVTVDSETASSTVVRRGRHIVVGRYLTEVVPIELIVPLSDAEVSPTRSQHSNFVDEEIQKLLATLGVPKSPSVDDATFLRRVTLDLVGRLPDLAQTQIALAGKLDREQLIDRLLASEEFNEYWTLQLAKLLRIHGVGRDGREDSPAMKTYHNWLKEKISADVGYDELARAMLLATGDTNEVGPASFYRTVGGPREQAEFMSELFMGSRLRCANCHNHPLDRWTQDDYHGLSAIFAKLEYGEVIKPKPKGQVIHPRTLEPAGMRIPGEYNLTPENSNGRQELTDWLTSDENPYFAKAIVNRLWKYMMGRGLIEPTDDLRATNPATHPQLLSLLASDFIENGYSLRHTLRRIASSDAYSRSANAVLGNKDDDRFYSHSIRQPLEAEVLADAIADVLQVAEQYGAQPIGTRAVSLMNPKTPSKSLDVLGRCDRDNSCESTSTDSADLSQKMHLFNGPLLNERINAPSGRLHKMLDAQTKPLDVVKEFYQVALCRDPARDERKFWETQLDSVDESGHPKLLEDFVWSLLTCEEFVTNH